MLAFAANRFVRRWRTTAIIILAIAIPLAFYGIVSPVNSEALGQLQAYSRYSAGYVVVDTGSYSSGQAPTVYISQQNISTIKGMNGVSQVYGILQIGSGLPVLKAVGGQWQGIGAIGKAYLQSNCTGPIPPPAPNIRYSELGANIVAFNTSAIPLTNLPYQVVTGRFPGVNETDAIAVNSQTQQCLGLSVGDAFTLSQEVTLGSGALQWYNATVHVVGIYTSAPSIGADIGGGQMPEGIMGVNAALTRYPFYAGRYSSAWVIVGNVNDVQQIGGQIQSTFPSFRASYPQNLVQKTIPLLEAAANSYSLVTYLALASAAVAIFAVKSIDFGRRRPEAGLLVSQGWKNGDLLKFELELSALQGIAGGFVALLLSYLLRDTVIGFIGFGNLLSGVQLQFFDYEIVFLVVMATAVLVCWLATSFAFVRTRKLTPVSLIRH